MKKTRFSLIVPLAACILCASAQGLTFFADNFGTQATGPEDPLSPQTGGYLDLVNISNAMADADNWFGEGTNNGILRFYDPGPDVARIRMGEAAGDDSWNLDVGRFSFDYYELAPTTGTIRINLVGCTNGMNFIDLLGNGTYRGRLNNYEYGKEQLVHFDLYFNTTDDEVEFEGVTLPARRMQCYVDGSFGSGNLWDKDTLGSVSNIYWFSVGSAEVQGYFDNTEVAGIPEPFFFGALALAGAALLRRRR